MDDYKGSGCNYCTLQSLKKKYETRENLNDKEFKVLEMRPENNWIVVYLVTYDRYLQKNGEEWKASFMGLTASCAC